MGRGKEGGAYCSKDGLLAGGEQEIIFAWSTTSLVVYEKKYKSIKYENIKKIITTT